jgi:uncharacterized protein YecE (DUF72 family)
MGDMRIGCSGWNYRDWRGTIYPPKCPSSRWLEHYATLFDSVEVNSTFYRLASRDAVARWVTQTPDDFVFTLKASRYLTHIKRLADVEQGIARYYERIEPLIGTRKLGPVLWQLPENFHRDDERLAGALQALPEGRHCFEFRHASWFVPEVMSLLRKHGVALVIGDHPKRPFQTLDLTADFTVVRFHYGARGRRGNYSDTELKEWVPRLRRLRERADVFAYFNNDREGFAVRNGQTVQRLLGVRPGRPRPAALAGRP